MSDKFYTIKISSEAYDDLTDIQQYTFEAFGESQLFRYESRLNEALILIRTNPKIGHS